MTASTPVTLFIKENCACVAELLLTRDVHFVAAYSMTTGEMVSVVRSIPTSMLIISR